MLYLDSASTVNILPCVSKTAIESFEQFYNPTALYKYGAAVKQQIEQARCEIAKHLNCLPEEIYFTSGATESNNWAIFSAVKNKNNFIITSDGEHASVYEPITALKNQGIKTIFAGLDNNTFFDYGDCTTKLDAIKDSDCSLVSIIHASNETGAINNIKDICSKLKQRYPKAIFHADGVQAFGKIETDVKQLGVDLYSISGHKVGAFKGIGVLYIKKGINLKPLLYGGGQENKMRSGTENLISIMGLVKAITHYKNTYNAKHNQELKQHMFSTLCSSLSGITQNGCMENSLSHILSLSIDGVKAEILQRILCDKDDILIGLGSSCASSKRDNRVLKSAGKSKSQIESNIRLSFGIDISKQDVDYACKQIVARVNEYRKDINWTK